LQTRRKEAQINIIPVIIEKHICGDVTFFEQQIPRLLSADDWAGLFLLLQFNSHFAVLISPVKSVVTSKGLAHALEAGRGYGNFFRGPLSNLLSNFYAKMSGKKPSETK